MVVVVGIVVVVVFIEGRRCCSVVFFTCHHGVIHVHVMIITLMIVIWVVMGERIRGSETTAAMIILVQ